MRNPIPLSGYSEDLRRLMARIGPSWGADAAKNRNLVRTAFEPLLRDSPREGVTVTRDLAYGPHPRHRLDIHRPPTRVGAAPILVFVHGGAFVRGDKNVTGELYGNVPTWFARQGYLGINLEYRLAPDAPYPAGAEDVALAVSWIRANARAQGGDPDRLYLMGHSAGGTHVASYAYDPALGHLGKGVAAIVLVSARLRADVSPENPNAAGVRAYFGDDEGLYEVRSPVTHAATSALPTFIAIAEYENPLLDVYGAELFYRLSLARRRAVRFLRLTRHNHLSIVAHFNTHEEILGREILDFLAEGR